MIKIYQKLGDDFQLLSEHESQDDAVSVLESYRAEQKEVHAELDGGSTAMILEI